MQASKPASKLQSRRSSAWHTAVAPALQQACSHQCKVCLDFQRRLGWPLLFYGLPGCTLLLALSLRYTISCPGFPDSCIALSARRHFVERLIIRTHDANGRMAGVSRATAILSRVGPALALSRASLVQLNAHAAPGQAWHICRAAMPEVAHVLKHRPASSLAASE